MRTLMLVLAAVACLGTTGCAFRQQSYMNPLYDSSRFYAHVAECREVRKNFPLDFDEDAEAYKACMRDKGYQGPQYAPGVKSTATRNQTSVAKDTAVYEYPKRTSNIIKIYNIAKEYDKKDQYITTDVHRKKFYEKLNKALLKDGTMVIRIPSGDDGSLKIYDADTEIFKFYVDTTYFSNTDFGYPSSQKGHTFLRVVDNTKRVEKSGRNAFGVVGHYTLVEGAYYGVYANTLFRDLSSTTLPAYELSGVSPDQAKGLRKNREVFLVCKPQISPKGVMACQDVDYDEPKITSSIAMSVWLRVINVEPIALLLCDKASKKVLKQITF